MTTSITALHLSRSALSLIEQLETKPATRIAAAVSEWNICVQQAGFTGTFDFPTTGYTRKAQVIADLKRCIEQLNEIRIDADRNTGRPVDEEGNDTREWSGNDIEAAHAEALDINRWIDDAHCVGGVAFEGAADAIIAVRERSHAEALVINDEWDAKERHARWCAFIGSNDHKERRAIVDAAHAEALLINERMTAIDVQMAFISMPPFSQAVAFAEAHAEALAMNEEISLVREIESLTYVQAIAYSDQWDFFNSAPEAQVQMIEAAHAEALANEVEEDHELALKMNCWFDALRGRFDLFWSDSVAPVRARILATHHVNALHINALINGLVGEIREAMTEAEANEGDHMIAIKIEGTGLELESADVRFAAETAGRLARVAA